MKVLKSLVTAAIITSIAAPAFAWGQREQDFLKGMVAASVLGSIGRNARAQEQQAPRYVERQYVQPRYQEPRRQERVAARMSDRQARIAYNSFSPRARYAIQNELALNGYYYGNIDGSWGPGTWKALRAYAADLGALAALTDYNGTMAIFEELML